MPGVDWHLWKAQLWQESRLDPTAESAVGAKGLAQFMPATWEQVTRELGMVGMTRQMAGPAIIAGAYYMGKLRLEWSSPRPERDRHSLAMASYNAGLGSLLAAQRRCRGALLYAAIVRCLPAVTGAANAHQTTTYVSRIFRWYRAMVLAR